ncbi:hypothetical protein IF2G_09855 [Cordyceps javanica]|nr:hypothetical protein IF2G_09855 [Cordyceps javanica]
MAMVLARTPRPKVKRILGTITNDENRNTVDYNDTKSALIEELWDQSSLLMNGPGPETVQVLSTWE